MRTCARCQTANALTNRFCQQCGRPLDVPTPPTGPDATVRWGGQQMPVRLPQTAASVATLFGAKDRVVIGRAPDCDVCLPHPMVSRYHALLERRPDGLRLRDLGSVNGVSVAGRRIAEPVLVQEGERVGIGPFLFSLRAGIISSLDSSRSLRLEAHGLEKVVALPGGGSRKLLDDVSLVVDPGEFVSLLGPSGSGKSTLMDCLNGRRRATAGRVLANGEDFYRHFDSFRQSLGYVPQRDIVHTQLSVFRALYYTARLRLPIDTDPAELRARLEKVLKEMELGPHRDTLVANLSGGQIKRVSLGAELLAEPCLLYIDEATSGLDAGTEARMMRLFRDLADQGRSIVCITHNVDNVEQCHLALVLLRGRLVYYGPPREAPRYFGVHRISEIYDRLSEKSPDEWARAFAGSVLYQEFVHERLAAPTIVPSGRSAEVPHELVPETPPAADVPEVEPLPAAPRWLGALGESGRMRALAQGPALAERFRALTARYLRWREFLAPFVEGLHQFRVLTARYVELLWGDARGLRLLLLQAPLVAAFLLVGFLHKDYDSKVPLPRPLAPGERRVLIAVEGLDRLLAGSAELNAEQRKELDRVHFQIQVAGVPVKLDGTRAVELLRQLQKQALDPTNRETLEKVSFTFEVDGEPVPVNGEDVAGVLRSLHQSQVPAKLLAYSGPVVPDREWYNPRYTYMLLFILVMVVLWFGCNNAAKEIVKEEAIYGRERAVNLGIAPYLASKFLVLSVITTLHAVVLMVLVYGTLEVLHRIDPAGHSVPPPELRLNYLGQLGVLVLLAMCGVALGLLLSACVSSPDRANALLPYVLIPQIILGGGILSVDEGPLRWLAMALSPVYWGFRAVHKGGHVLPAGFPGHVPYEAGAALPCEALVLQTVVLLLLTAWFLYRKEA
jgi:ABC-type multidrug transport system ATPase subunit